MFCPNFKNKTVFDGFNDIIKAFGGNPMTEEEFKSSDLRNQREGLDFSAMEAAYRMYNLSNGFLPWEATLNDPSKDPVTSILFDRLLDIVKGDVYAAIRAKSYFYSNKYINENGRWMDVNKFNIDNIDKSVVDVEQRKKPWKNDPSKENETIRIYIKDHHEKGYFELVKDKEVGYFSVHFKTAKPGATHNGNFEYSTKDERKTLFKQLVNAIPEGGLVSTWGSLSAEGIHGLDNVGRDMQKVGERIASFKDDESEIRIPIYRKGNDIVSKLDANGEPFIKSITKPIKKMINSYDVSSEESLFGNASKRLQSGEIVTSDNILDHMAKNECLSSINIPLANILKIHQIPTRLASMPDDKLMTTVTDEFGQSVILINQSYINKLSNSLISDSYIHEIVHALTVPMFENPKTKEEKELKQNTKHFLDIIRKIYPRYKYNYMDRRLGFYALCNEKEFVAEFVTNEAARNMAYSAVQYADNKKSLANFIRRFINSISKALINKNLFKTNTEKLQQYENALGLYLTNVNPIAYSKYSRSQMLSKFEYSTKARYNDRVYMLGQDYQFMIDNFESNNSMSHDTNGVPFTQEESMQRLNECCGQLSDILKRRLVAIKASNLPTEEISQQSEMLRSQIEQLNSNITTKFDAISQFLVQVASQMLNDSRQLRSLFNRKGAVISHTDYMYQMHDNFGTYNKALQVVKSAIERTGVRDILQSQIPQDQSQLNNLQIRSVEQMLTYVSQINDVISNGILYCGDLLMNNVKASLKEIADETDALETYQYIENIEKIVGDVSSFFVFLGSADRANDDGVRALVHIIDKAISEAGRKTKAQQVKLLQLQEELPMGVSVKMLYEYNNSKIPTGYLVRKYNYGQFFEDYNKFLTELNTEFQLEPDNRMAPDDQSFVSKEFIKKINKKFGTKLQYAEDDINKETVTSAWNKIKNHWLGKHCERRYKPEYYEAYANLSPYTRQRSEEIQGQIRVLVQQCKGSDGYYHYEKLSDKDFRRLQDLYIQKRILKDTLDINGDPKVGEELKVALELQNLDKTLNPESKQGKYEANVQKWEQARSAEFKACGGKEEFDKGENGNFNFKRWEKWIERNCEFSLKRNPETGKALLFEKIESEVETLPVYEFNGDGGVRYKELKDQFNKIINSRKDYATGEIGSILPVKITKKLRDLEKEMGKIRKLASRSDSVKVSKIQYRRALEKYTVTQETALYKKMREEARAAGFLGEFLKRTGYDVVMDDSGITTHKPYKWYTKIMPKPEYMDEFFEVKPGKGWIDYETSGDLINGNFDEKENMDKVPKKALYDNSAAYKIATQGKLGEVYDQILTMMKQANSKYSNRKFNDDYLLPQITGDLWDRRSSFWFNLKNYIKDGVGNGDFATAEEIFGQHIDNIIEERDETGALLNEKEQAFGGDVIHGRRPDGRELHIIPQYYTRKLANPSQISKDICGITSEYYRQAMIFEEKSKVKDLCESLLDVFENRKIIQNGPSLKHSKDEDKAKNVIGSIADVYKNIQLRGTREIAGVESNAYRLARHHINTHLYNVKTDPGEVKIGTHPVKLGRIAQLCRSFTTARNLGMNMAVAATGWATSSLASLYQMLAGKRYNVKIGVKANLEQILQFVKSVPNAFNIADSVSKNKLQVIAEELGISNQDRKKYEHSNRNRTIKALVSNWCFGFLTTGDYIVKTHIMLCECMSYRYFRGKFVTEEDLRNDFYDLSKEAFNKIKKEWNDGKCLYDCMDTKTGKVEIINENEIDYKSAYDKIFHKLRSRANKHAEDADGMATESQKAAISSTILGSALLTHRQYFPLMLQNAYGKMVYDFDTQQYEGGIFRDGARGIKLLALPFVDMIRYNFKIGQLLKMPSKYQAKNSALFGASLGCLVDAMLIGSPATMVGTTIGAALSVLSSADSNSIKYFDELFNNKSSKAEYKKSRARLQNLKLIAAQLIIYNAMITPFVNSLAALADDDDNDQDKIMFALVKYLVDLLGIDSESNALQFAALVGRRVQWETYTMYRFSDINNNIRTVSAQTGTLDKFESAGNALYKSIFPRETLFETILSIGQEYDSDDYDPYVNRGLYSESELREYLLGDSRWTKLEKALFKLLPFSHVYEQMFDSKSKRKYFENQIMKNNE